MTSPLVDIRHANVTLQWVRAIADISWQLRRGEHWAVVGPNGSGKSTLLRLVRGDIWPDPDGRGRRIYSLDGLRGESPIGVRERIAFVSPEREDTYMRKNWDLMGEEVTHTGFFDSVWIQERPREDEIERGERVIGLLGIGDVRRRSILSMSEGEARKVIIARALVADPVLMILDEVCSGLDPVARKDMLLMIEKVGRSMTRLVLVTHHLEDLVPSITHVLLMDGGMIVAQGEKAAMAQRPQAGGTARPVRTRRSRGGRGPMTRPV